MRHKGDRGPKGDTGSQGAPGVSGLIIVARTTSTTAGFQGVSINCPADTRALGGGVGTQTPGEGSRCGTRFRSAATPAGSSWPTPSRRATAGTTR